MGRKTESSRRGKTYAVLAAFAIACVAAIAALAYFPSTLTDDARSLVKSVISAPAPTPEATPQILAVVQPTPQIDAAAWYRAHEENPDSHGVLIEGFDGKRVLASHNADAAFNPASLVKLATSFAALRKFGADYRFTTKVYADAEPDAQGILNGKIYLQSDDPLFGDAGAQAVARELKARGVKRVAGGFVAAPNLCFNFTDDPQDVTARLNDALKLGDKKNSAKQSEPRQTRGRRNRSVEKRESDENATQNSIEQEPSGRLLFTLASYRLRDVLLYMNAHSNNFIAEHLGAMVGGAGAVEKFLRDELKADDKQVVITRTSGLEYNRMTPRVVLALIRALDAEVKRQNMRLEDILAVAGDIGTLRHRFLETTLAGAVVGKTGTLTQFDGGTANLAGIVHTKNGEDIVFVFFDAGRQIWKNHQIEEAMLTDVVTQRDQPAPAPVATPRELLPPAQFQTE